VKKILVPEVVTAPRQTGKTTQAIKKAAESFGYIVCHSSDECQRIANEAQRLKLIIPFPITFDEFLKGQFYSKGIKCFIIDEVDLLLSRFAKGIPIAMITISQREEVVQLTWREFIQRTIWDNNEGVSDILRDDFPEEKLETGIDPDSNMKDSDSQWLIYTSDNIYIASIDSVGYCDIIVAPRNFYD